MNAPGGGPEDAGPSNTVAVDTSALVAIFLREEDPVDYGSYLHQHYCLIGWPTLVEFHRVMVSKTGDADQREVLDYLEAQPNIRFVPFGPAHFRAAAAAFARFGKGRHPAALNYGDCMSYAVAKHAGVPILFKGNDFAQTDLASAVEIR